MDTKNQKGFVQIIVILIALVLVAGGVYYFGTKNKTVPSPVASTQPTSNPTTITDPNTNWKIFTNPILNASFKYPPEWGQPTVNQLSTSTEFVFTNYNFTITYGVRYNQDLGRELTYQEMIAENSKSGNPKSVTVDGVQAKEFIFTIGESTIEPLVTFQKPGDKLIYWITADFPAGTNPELFDQILSTFKFTN